jgi:hypothetical protein
VIRVPVSIKRVRWLGLPWVRAMVPLKRRILVRRDVVLTERLLAHELKHVQQAERHPWPLAYVTQWVLTGFKYRRMPFERQARAAEDAPFYRLWARDLLRELGGPAWLS